MALPEHFKNQLKNPEDELAQRRMDVMHLAVAVPHLKDMKERVNIVMDVLLEWHETEIVKSDAGQKPMNLDELKGLMTSLSEESGLLSILRNSSEQEEIPTPKKQRV